MQQPGQPKMSKNGKSFPQPSSTFEAFPEPRGWSQEWDGGALQALAVPRPKPPQTRQ
ncbi:MAG: hypothetical protein GYB65_10215 [Chloroflexi bacterium]|nr:hypothetical protein [Chloroflexota bacterium]